MGRVRPSDGPGAFALGAALLVEAVVLWGLALPQSLRMDKFLIGDFGANLAAEVLLDRGYRPGFEFGYPYGLLSLAFGRLWFRVAGATPFAYQLAMLACNVLAVWGVARLARARRISWAGFWLIALAMPYWLMPSYFNFAHALEAVLLCHALAEHAWSRRDRALALSTLCVFVKPSLCLFYIVVLIALEIKNERRGFEGWVRFLGPSVAVGLLSSLIVWGYFGLGSLRATIVPTSASEAYRAYRFGFFRGIGREVWAQVLRRPGEQLGTGAWFWLVGMLALTVLGLEAAWRLLRRRATGEGVADDELLATCAGLHALFLMLAFAGPWSWTYYSVLVVLGLAVFAGRVKGREAIVWCLVSIALVGDLRNGIVTCAAWMRMNPSEETAGLWAFGEERAEWRRVLDLTRGRDAAVLAMAGGAGLLFREYPEPESYFLLRGISTASEIERTLAQLARADVIVVPRCKPVDVLSPEHMAEFAVFLRAMKLVHDGPDYRVYERREDGASAAGAREPGGLIGLQYY